MFEPLRSLTPSLYFPSAFAAFTSASSTSVKYPKRRFCPRTGRPEGHSIQSDVGVELKGVS